MQLIRFGGAAPGGLRQARNFIGQLPQVLGLGILDDGHHQTGIGLCGHAKMHRAIPRHHARFIVVPCVDHREIGQCLADRGDQQRKQRQLGLIAAVGIELSTQFFQRSHIAFFHVGKVRDVALRRGHVLGNAAAHADDLLFLVLAGLGSGAITRCVRQELVQIAMTNAAIFGRLHLCQIDTEIACPLAHGRRCQNRRIGLLRRCRGRRRGGCWRRARIGSHRVVGIRWIGIFDLDPLFYLVVLRRWRCIGRRLVFLDHLVGHFAFDFDHDEHGADRHHVALAARDLENLAGHRAFHGHGGLVGHHVDEFLVFSDRIADLLVPLHDFGLGDAFADIGHVEGEFRHGDQSLRILSMASPMRTGPGK